MNQLLDFRCWILDFGLAPRQMRGSGIRTGDALHLGLILALSGLLSAMPAAAAPNPRTAAPNPKSKIQNSKSEYLGTPATERAVERALKYLQKAQNSDGSWDSSTYTAEVGITGLCCLAFLSAGHQPGRGPYGRVLARATDFLADKVQRTGLVYNAAGSPGPPMYGHGFATLALAELYGQSKRRDLRDKLERAVKLILTTQNEEGGWRYQPRVADADISVSVSQVMALRAAHNAGVPVPRDVIQRAIDYMKECANNADGGFSYMPSQRVSGPARTGAGILSLILAGERKAPEVQRGLQYLMEHPPGTREQHLFYGVYYNTQAMYQAGGAYWRFWFPRLASYLLDTQRQEGSWWDGPGAPYATAMGVLALQVPAHLLPIYQR
jgi:hypothetical protein